jgi:Na+/H+-dicarboxylate symporter
MTFSRKILLGLVLGVATGIFLGDRAAPFRLLADGFVRLLQMTVLPYVTVSLIAGIGSLDAAAARRLFLRVGALTLVLWALALGAVFLMPLVFPQLQSASFFSTTMVEERASTSSPSTSRRTPSTPSPTASCPRWCSSARSSGSPSWG